MRAFSLSALVLSATTLLGGCVSSIEPDVDITQAPDEDSDYFSALTKASRERTIFKDFETRYILSATYLSPEFRQAFGSRLERVFKRGEPQFQEARDKAGFFVTLNAPGNEDRVDLTNPHYWTLLLETKDGVLKPVLVKRVNDKERWRPFFPKVSKWTTEFLVVFDTPNVNANSAQLVEKMSVHLTLANADAKVSLTW